MKLKKIILGFSVLVLFSAVWATAAPNSWIHVRVDSEQGEKVRVNLPMALISTVLPILEEKKLAHARIQMDGIELGEGRLTVADMREIWASIRSQGSYELANVEKDNQKVKVFLDGGYLRVETLEHANEQVQVRLPVAVVDALLSGPGDELDLMAAVNALAGLGEQQLVEVRSEDSSVKIWIDQSNNGN